MNTNFYSSTGNYNKTLVRLENNLQSGRFATYTRHKKTQIWNRLCRYARQLGITIKGSIAAACLAAGLSFVNPSAAQTFTQRTGAANPFNGVNPNYQYKPTFADIDSDGDMDGFVGAGDGTIRYYKNTGTATAPIFTAQIGVANPFNGVDHGNRTAPSFVDVDADGDLDSFLGIYDGVLHYYKNTGTATAPVFALQAGAANPFNGVDIGSVSTPDFLDIDVDGDMDLFMGARDGTIVYFKNTGTASAAVFTLQIGAANPFNGVDVGTEAHPAFTDVDRDGDKDVFIGQYDGTLSYYRNTGTAAAPVFVLQTSGNNPLSAVQVSYYSAPTFEDIDGDGDMDAFIGAANGGISYYENTSAAVAPPTFAEQTGVTNPFNGVDIGVLSSPVFIDIDGDGDLDAFIGEDDGNINYYQNTGTALAPVFTAQTGAANPFDGVDIGNYSAPAFADIDGDGDLDAFIGENDGNINYYKNTGTVLAPVFTEQTGPANLFNGVDVGLISRSNFADIDGDGDMDAFIGEQSGIMNYYQNTGTALAPVFTEQTGAANPFDGVDFGDITSPAFADIDGDGDLDSFIGENDGNINYYQNTGTVLAPVFTEQTGPANPFNGVDVGFISISNFADIDGDGDMDAFIGELDGNINYYQITTAILPLHLLSFSGSKQSGFNLLQWQTADEVDTKWFEIERSSDGRHFIKIAIVNTAGNSNNNYSINDNVVYNGKIYYRLKMVDIDGRFTYSPIIWISNDQISGISIYPNPVKDVININMGSAPIVKTMAGIYDVNGRLMQNILISNNQQQVNVKSFAPGAYIIKFADGTVHRFMKN